MKKKKVIIDEHRVITHPSAEKNTAAEGLMKDIFTDNGDGLDDLKTMVRKKFHTRRNILVGFGVLLVLAGLAATAGFILFNPDRKSFSEKGVSIRYNGPVDTTSGDGLHTVVEITNNEKTALTDVVVDVTYPDGFVYQTSNYGPTGEHANQWQMDDMMPGEKRQLEISGTMTGEVGSSHAFGALLSYRPTNFNSEFQQQVDWTVVISSSTLLLNLTGAQEVISGQAAAMSLSYRNSSTKNLERIRLKVQWPTGFVLHTALPDAETDGSWFIDSLASGQEERISLTGTFIGEPGTQQEIVLQGGLMQADGEFQLQTTHTALALFINPDIEIQLSGKEADAANAVRWGETLSRTVTIKNSSDFVLTDATITLAFEFVAPGSDEKPEVFDWSTLVNPQHANRRGNTLTWGVDNTTELKEFRPGDTVAVSGDVNTVNIVPPALVGTNNLSLRLLVTVAGQRESDNGSIAFEKKADPASIPFASAPSLVVEARYYDASGNPVGQGPFPPTVGQDTTLKITWTLANTSSELTDVRVTTTLPEQAHWLGRATVSAGLPLEYAADNRTITWVLNRLPAWNAQTGLRAQADFFISITPTATDIGQYVPLTSASTLRGKDSWTLQTLEASQPLIDTSLPQDATAGRRGRVIGVGY